MQATRQRILDIMRERGPATVADLSVGLKLTPVTVRHHLDILRRDGLVSTHEVRRLHAPGRPQYLYHLTDAASAYFPDNYPGLVGAVLDRIQGRLAPAAVNVFFAEIGHDLAQAAPPPVTGETMDERLSRVTAFLTEKGYVARWEHSERGYLLHTYNCPYREIADEHQELCIMDLRLVTELLGNRPVERISRVVEGAASCSYLIPE
jgi:predicted ArsR family transcriptional regulator